MADVLALIMEMAMDRLFILQKHKHVTTQCYYFDSDPLKSDTEQEVVDCIADDPKPTSLMWSLPFGMTFVIEIPMDFDLDAGSFPLEIEFDGDKNEAPALTIGWSFDLGFGFDEVDGFFLYTVRAVTFSCEGVQSKHLF